MPKKKFTTEDVETLKEMLNDGHQQIDIARRLGFSPGYISLKVKELGLRNIKAFPSVIRDETDEIDFYTCVHEPTKQRIKLQMEKIFIKGKKFGYLEAEKIYKSLIKKERKAFAEKLFKMKKYFENDNKQRCEAALKRKAEKIENDRTFKN